MISIYWQHPNSIHIRNARIIFTPSIQGVTYLATWRMDAPWLEFPRKKAA